MTGPWAGLVRFWSVALAISGVGLGVPVAAQGTLPENPPELKDFRLDTPKPREEVPQPQPQAQPKAETPTPKAEPVRQQPIPERAGPARTAPDAPSGSTSEADEPVAPAETGSATSDLVLPDASATDGTTVPAVDQPAENPAVANQQSWSSWWPIVAALLAALLAYGLFRLLQKRVADNAAKIASPARPQPAPLPVRKTAPLPTKPAASLTARFETGDARLSLANLTITGQLHLKNAGQVLLEGLAMRTLVMSACDGQAAIIDTFHSDPASDQAQGDREVLGNMKPGESITLKLELKVPRDALSAFDWRERRFVAPIVLVNIASEDPDVAPCRLSCVVGQPGAADSGRLMPIPIDRGPKRFDAVQFQPIAA